jgi:hypothetical protein
MAMTDTPEEAVQMSFVRWLHAQAKGDADRTMPYSAIYRWGPNIQNIIGLDGKYSAEWVALELAQQGANAEDLAALASAEAAWRVDSVIDHAETAGVPLPEMESSETGAEITEHLSQALETSDAKVLCGYRNHRGEGCVSEAVPGAGRCGRHGGAITDPEVRRSFLLVAFAKVIDGSRVAVDALLDVAENGRSEMARVQAAKELLDRAGVQQDQHVHIHKPSEDTSEDELLDALRNRLLETKNRLRLTAIEIGPSDYTPSAAPSYPVLMPVTTSGDEEIVDADIVEDQ